MSNIPAHILVVDDNPATRYSTSRVLASAGWTVVEAETGTEAIEKAQSDIDLVVLDVNLPDMDGFAVCRRLRTIEQTSRVPILHLSATFTTSDSKVTGLEAGADGYLTHPIEPPVLIATVNAFLRARSAETELRRSNARFKAIFDNALNGVSILDDNLVYVDVNPSLCDLLRTDRERIVGRRLAEFVPPTHYAQIGAIEADLAAQRAWRGRLPLKRSDGSLVYLDWNLSIHRDPGLRLAIVSDITERMRYEQEREQLLQNERIARTDAERANSLKDDFLATLSHELRTPLNSIVGWSQILRIGTLEPGEVAEGLAAIERNALAQSQMIADLLDVSRITAGKILLDLQPLDLAKSVDAILTSLLPAAATKSVQITRHLDPSAGLIRGDAARFQQILGNLVNNAIKFTPAGGRVEVAIEPQGDEVEIRVSDTGRGISAELLPDIFERFRQADSSSTREHGGLGLGLGIAKQLAEMHGGTIQAESPGEGAGATFRIRLPRLSDEAELSAARESAKAQAAADAESAQADLSGVRILIVEDDADSRALLRRLILGIGAQVIEAASAAEAVTELPRSRPHLLISDVGMPGRDGLDLMRDIRSQGYSEEILPAIALTAFAREEDRSRALSAGFQIHLTKPIDAAKLRQAIAHLTVSAPEA